MGSGGPLIIIWIVIFFGIFYFLAVRPQRRQRQAHQEMVTMLKKGDDIVTIGGMFGTVRRLGDDWVEIEVARGTRVRFLKRAISQIVSEEEEEEEEYEDEIEAADEDVVEGEPVEEAADEEVVEEEVVDEEPVDETADGEEATEDGEQKSV
jgi:preprotein translocase subunit YajC